MLTRVQHRSGCRKRNLVSPGGFVPERGDIVWITLNPQAGSEQAGRRIPQVRRSLPCQKGDPMPKLPKHPSKRIPSAGPPRIESFDRPVLSRFTSDGTLKMLDYLIVLPKVSCLTFPPSR
jgi:hypothetical protein